MLTRDDYLYYTDRALAGMVQIVTDLGDDRANAQAYPGANTPYALLHHCLAVIDAWVGGFVSGRVVERDRDAEFDAQGRVEDLVARAAVVADQMRRDVADASPEAPLRREPPAAFLGPQRALTQGAALQHVFEELAQHHGQMESLRDVLMLMPAPVPAR
ncbi:DinB family protein [Mycobacterium sp. PS03-16]|uniref:DinB family protein n=1 Tax=Mycobacterium sp. PS03-16 TaxID=2559611 RepID=UPI0010733BAA|nr:DinB family protein [Mycobacterium sp. PS03-16]TFV61542.1 DinB family protein [Mycobacterium sp. PS03-16]